MLKTDPTINLDKLIALRDELSLYPYTTDISDTSFRRLDLFNNTNLDLPINYYSAIKQLVEVITKYNKLIDDHSKLSKTDE